MTIRRKIFEMYLALVQRDLLRTSVTQTRTFGYEAVAHPQNVDIITVAFNNLQVIAEQIRLVRKYVQDAYYTHIVVDNSPSEQKREQIYALCKQEGVMYIAAPKIRWRLRPSYSHGVVLNWAYQQVVLPRRPRWFAFIDHDIFPIHPYSFTAKIAGQDFYGAKVQREQSWYLWAGFCCFDLQRLSATLPLLNFSPTMWHGAYLDTGGSNYGILYQHYAVESLRFPLPREEKQIRTGTDYHADYVHLYDGAWLHTINGSYWKKVESKEAIIARLLAEY